MNKNIVMVLIVLLVVGVGAFAVMKNKPTTLAPTDTQPSIAMEETQTASPSDTTMKQSANAVTIKGFAFTQTEIRIKKGETVTWTNEDGIGHTATADDGTFDTGHIQKGESKTVTFDKAGTFAYHCTPHPNMKATVIVE